MTAHNQLPSTTDLSDYLGAWFIGNNGFMHRYRDTLGFPEVIYNILQSRSNSVQPTPCETIPMSNYILLQQPSPIDKASASTARSME